MFIGTPWVKSIVFQLVVGVETICQLRHVCSVMSLASLRASSLVSIPKRRDASLMKDSSPYI